MKTVFNKTLLAAALATSLGVASTNVMAVVFPDFTVVEAPGSVPGAGNNTFVADKITGNYVEVATFTDTGVIGDGIGNFAVSLKWEAGQFVANDGTTPLITQLNGFGANGYGLYALFQGGGTYVTSLLGVTTFTFALGLGGLNVYIDPLQNTILAPPAPPVNGSTTPWTGVDLDDYLIATGTTQSGTGTLDPTLPTCTGGINCGSFGTTTSFALTSTTPGGSTYFTVPNPFYNLSFQSGQLNNFTPVGTQTINGSLDVVFGNSVPEPATLALLGLGLMGMGVVARRRKAA